MDELPKCHATEYFAALIGKDFYEGRILCLNGEISLSLASGDKYINIGIQQKGQDDIFVAEVDLDLQSIDRVIHHLNMIRGRLNDLSRQT